MQAVVRYALHTRSPRSAGWNIFRCTPVVAQAAVSDEPDVLAARDVVGGTVGRFLRQQRALQAVWRSGTPWLTQAAKDKPGYYSKTGAGPYDFCLPLDRAAENLYPGIATDALRYFTQPPGAFGGRVAIPWHDGRNGTPSTHLCDSQVCCVNFLFPMRANQRAATALLSRVFDDCSQAVPVQSEDDGLVELEWLGNPTVELLGEGSPRQRGANATSMDAAMCFGDATGHRHLVLIEWKYTESYRGSERIGAGKFDEPARGRIRKDRYSTLFCAPESPIESTLVALDELGFEPFYQFLRQQLLAQALESDYSTVRVLHIAPRANSDFAFVTPERLRRDYPGATATGVWARLVRNPGVFTSAYTEDLFGSLLAAPPRGFRQWADYIRQRYSFMEAWS